ncbi:MAG: GGDEF domain-containing protein [Actinomycetota bacterium]
MGAVVRALRDAEPADRRVFRLVGLLLGVDLILTIALWRQGPVLDGFAIPWFVLLGLFVAAEWRAVHVHLREEASSFSLLEFPMVLGILFAPAKVVILTAMVGVAVSLRWGRRQPPRKVLFNVANVTHYVALTATLVHLTVDGPDLTRGAWLAVLMAVAVGSVAMVSMIILAITYTEGPPTRRTMGGVIGFGTTVAVTNTATSLAAALLLPLDGLSVLLLVAPLSLVFVAFQISANERERQMQLEFLHRPAEASEGGGDKRLRELVDDAIELFRAGVGAAVMLDQDEAGQSSIIRVSPQGTETLELSPVNAAIATEFAETLHGVVTASATTVGPKGALIRMVGADEAMMASLTADGRPLGVLVIGDRRGDAVDSFANQDLRTMAAVARQAAILLHTGQLEQTVSDLRRTEQRLAHVATHDGLTGLANRALLAAHLADAVTSDKPFLVLYVDLDDFKQVNDTFGHTAGDQVLVEVSARILRHVRPNDLVARLGGDEFAVLVRNRDDADDLASRMIRAVREPVDLGNGVTTQVGCSIGVAASAPGLTPRQLMDQADRAMYGAKRAGKNVVAIHVRQPAPAAT